MVVLVVSLVVFSRVSGMLVAGCFRMNSDLSVIGGFFGFFCVGGANTTFNVFVGDGTVLVVVALVLLMCLVVRLGGGVGGGIVSVSLSLVVDNTLKGLVSEVFEKCMMSFVSFAVFSGRVTVFGMTSAFVAFKMMLLLVCLFGRNGRREDGGGW